MVIAECQGGTKESKLMVEGRKSVEVEKEFGSRERCLQYFIFLVSFPISSFGHHRNLKGK